MNTISVDLSNKSPLDAGILSVIFVLFLFSSPHHACIPQLRLITHFRLNLSHASRKCIKYTQRNRNRTEAMLFNFLHGNTRCAVGHVIGEID